ncbi:hypothetical protein [Sulfitobacter sp. 1A12779]|uniref:hypothetical protein n=1 Tax=Sulfitobacter sp. 1A12779 TaxID=3368599 RepID=UPI00374A8D89
MISPEGYTSLYSILLTFSKVDEIDYDPVCVRRGLEKAEGFYAFSQETGLCALPKHVISTAHGELFLFLNETTWCVSMEHLRALPMRLGQEFDVNLGLFGVLNGSPKTPIPEVASSLVPFDGHALVVRENQAEVIRAGVRAAYADNRRRRTKRNLRGEEAREAFLAFIQENPNCTAEERDAFGIRNLSRGRDAARELWKELGPANGSKPGRKPIQR